jgi:hypothetical protein
MLQMYYTNEGKTFSIDHLQGQCRGNSSRDDQEWFTRYAEA